MGRKQYYILVDKDLLRITKCEICKSSNEILTLGSLESALHYAERELQGKKYSILISVDE